MGPLCCGTALKADEMINTEIENTIRMMSVQRANESPLAGANDAIAASVKRPLTVSEGSSKKSVLVASTAHGMKKLETPIATIFSNF